MNNAKKLIIDNQKYKELVSTICRDICINKWLPDYVVGISRGGLLPAVMISHYLNIPMYSLKISLRDDEDYESNLWMAEDAFGYQDTLKRDPAFANIPYLDTLSKNILIVDDINDTGATFNWLIEDWKSGCLPDNPRWDTVWGNNVRFAALVENTATKSKVKIEYIGMEVNKDKDNIWVEFPYENWWS
jgi:hypoxanthine phosphoribosyltransferase